MQKRSVKILLIVSLAFNLAFISFSVYRYIKIRRFSDPRFAFRHAPQVIKDRFREHREVIDPIRDEIQFAREQFMAELKKPDLDEELLKEKLANYLNKQADLEKNMGNNLIEIRKKLTPEQVEEFFSHFPQTKPAHSERRKFPRHFREKHEKTE